MNRQHSAKALIQRGSTVLMMQSESGRWELPGGKLEWGEDPRSGLQRELKEELGVDGIVIGKLVDARSKLTNIGEEKHYLFVIYRCELPEGKEFIVSDEHVAGRWIPLNEINDTPMWEIYRDVILEHCK